MYLFLTIFEIFNLLKMKKLLCYLLFCLSIHTYAQKEANIWYFGRNAALDFSSGTPLPYGNATDNKLNTFEGCSSFSRIDNGKLLFYIGAPSPDARNLTIWNKNNEPMPYANVENGGQLLLGDSSSSQAALTVPKPKSDPSEPDIYYVFTVGANFTGGNNRGFWYYTVDMSLEGGDGDVVGDEISLYEEDSQRSIWSEKITAVKGTGCNTFWVISFVQASFVTDNKAAFYVYKVDENGVDVDNPIISKISNYNITDPRGYLKVSPDGTKLVAANMNGGTYIFNFDKSTGIVNNFLDATVPSQLDLVPEGGGINQKGYGVEFSPSSERLYVSTGSFRLNINNIPEEYLFQFDLSLSTLSEINDSKFQVYTYRNSRGALQLAPNGKIYWTSDGNNDDLVAVGIDDPNPNNNISVINNPENLGSTCNYSHQSVDLGEGSPTQGLPPFIASLLLPVALETTDTGQEINNQTLQFCEGDAKTIKPNSEAIEGTISSYQWLFNDEDIDSELTLQLNDIKTTDAGVYTLTIELVDSCGNASQLEGTFTVEVFDKAEVVNTPTDVFHCDIDVDGFTMAAVRTATESQIIDSPSTSPLEVLYFESEVDAIANTNTLLDIEVFNIDVPKTIYARVHNTAAPNLCYDYTSFKLSVTGLPTPKDDVIYNLCDDSASGNDTDGITNNFRLSTKDVEILGSLDASQYTVSYYSTEIGANTKDATTQIDASVDYASNTQTVYARVENKDNEDCYTVVPLQLVVNPLPIITNIVALKQCDINADKQTTFNLTEAELSVSNNYENETFTYFATEAAAIAGTPQVTDKTAYFVDTTGEAWVRAISNFGCYRIAKINLTVSFAPNNPYSETFIACDDFLDADGNDTATNSDTDGITSFDFSNAPNGITSDPDIAVEFYESLEDRTASINEIQNIANYRNKNIPNTTGTPFPIYYKLISIANNDCQGLGEIYLQINSVPSATVVDNMIACDNLDDGNATNGEVAFNLESNTPTILGTQSAVDYTITYHESKAQAQSGANPLASPYTNTTRDLQTIYVRVTNNTTGCFTNHEQFDLIVNPLPVANFVDNIEICDDASDGSASNGYSQSIDLSVQTATILGTQDPTQFSVTYHDSLEHAQSGFPELNTTSFQNSIPFRQTIYVRVFNATTGCANGISTFDVIVHGAPNVLLTDISNLSLCDDATDGDDTNGIVQNFDLTTQTTSILNNYDSALHDDFTISYHTTQSGAETGGDIIPDTQITQYQNIPQPDGSPERIYIRVTNKDTGCISTDTYFDLIVNPLPDFEVTTPQIVCLNDTPLTLIAENPTASYSYQWTLVSDGSVLGNNQTLDVLEAGVYRVTATNTTTGCSRFYDITVNASEPAKFTLDDITIVDDSDNNTISINTTNLGIGDYEYALTNEQGDFVKNYQDTPVFENLEGGIYTILIRDKNGCDVTGIPTLTVPVIEYPKFFTPNNDGVNDTWFIKGANSTFFQSSAIYIFNRYGKAVAEIKLNEPGWDGTYNGKKLPSDDYWFSIKLTGRPDKTGNFSLLRK